MLVLEKPCPPSSERKVLSVRKLLLLTNDPETNSLYCKMSSLFLLRKFVVNGYLVLKKGTFHKYGTTSYACKGSHLRQSLFINPCSCLAVVYIFVLGLWRERTGSAQEKKSGKSVLSSWPCLSVPVSSLIHYQVCLLNVPQCKCIAPCAKMLK